MKLTLIAVLVMLAVTAQSNDEWQSGKVTTNSTMMAGAGGESLAQGQANELEYASIASINDYNSCTNAPSSDTYNIPPGQVTNAVRDLAASGDICRVFGHWWPSISIDTLYVTTPCGGTWSRTCRICGKTESKTEGSWK